MTVIFMPNIPAPALLDPGLTGHVRFSRDRSSFMQHHVKVGKFPTVARRKELEFSMGA